MTEKTDQTIRYIASLLACFIVGGAIGTSITGDKMPEKIKIEFCTSCGSQDIKVTGNKFYCPDCDITYKVTTQGTKVIETNPLGKEKARLDQCEQDIAELQGQKEPGPEPAEPTEPAEPAASQDESEPDGFITIED